MTIQQRTSKVLSQAADQWSLVDHWLGSKVNKPSVGTRDRLGFAPYWFLGIGWRLAIALALAASLIVDVIASLLGVAVELFDGLFGWPLAIVCAPLELLMSIPYLGRFLGWLWRIALSLVWGVLHFLELPMVLLSVMPERRLRLWIVPTAENLSSSAELENWLQAIGVAASLFHREANLRLIPVSPFRHGYGSSGGQDSFGEHEWIRSLRIRTEGRQLAVNCNLEALVEDLGPVGGQFERLALVGHPRGAYRRVSGWGAPLMALAVHSVAAGELAGCSLGPLTDYLTIRHDHPVCLAHEIGHACNLPHSSSPNNLMNPTCRGVHLNRWQVFLLRLSRHVTYL